MKKKLTDKKIKKRSIFLLGELREPTSFFFNGLELPNVFRVLGDDKHGYLYQFIDQNGNRKANANPMWDDRRNVPESKRKSASIGQTVWVYKTYQKATVVKYVGSGFYSVRFENGDVANCNIESFQKARKR